MTAETPSKGSGGSVERPFVGAGDYVGDGGAALHALPFVGAGDFVGDGGAALQSLWDAAAWKALRNCPGRYAHAKASRELGAKPPEQLLADLFGAAAPPLTRLEIPGKDPIDVARLPGGGGLLTYAKSGGRYVHTLNTESGLVRKCEALAIAPATLFPGDDGSRARRFSAVLGIIAFLDDEDTNASAYALVRRLRRVP